MWNSIGRYVDGWARFGVAVVALGWFGFQVAERYSPRSATVTIGQPERAEDHRAVPTAAPEGTHVEADGSLSVFSELTRELGAAVRLLAANTLAHLAVALAVGVTGGLAIRPSLNRWREGRAVRAAQRRAERHAADLRLLAAHDARRNVPGPAVASIQPMKRH